MDFPREIWIPPCLPERIRRLGELAYNFWFGWNPDAVGLFQRIDPDLWFRVRYNPVRFLREVSQKRLNAVVVDRSYILQYNRVFSAFDTYMTDPETWFARHYPGHQGIQIAYFSAEYALHESLPIYSGGLGVLAGDFLKSASDLGLPLVAVGLLYHQGYFTQEIDLQGNQRAIYHSLDFDQCPITRVRTPEGEDLLIQIDFPGRTVWAQVWKAQVGRSSLYLLDTDVASNSPQDRMITYQLYGGDREMRISQEIVLGIGGVRLLRALGIHPQVWHLNEGHSVFLGLERLRWLMKEMGLSFQEALELVRCSTVFTTHTPVPAGHDVFTPDLVAHYFQSYCEELGISVETLLSLGLESQPDGQALFNLTTLAFRLAGYYNGVSRLHGEVTSRMWAHLWHGVPPEENPVTYVTNGIHISTWVSPAMADLYEQYLGPDWYAHSGDRLYWRKVREIPDDIFWSVRHAVKRQMIEEIRDRIRRQLHRCGASPGQIKKVDHLLHPEALTIGFARRFATYKRATLLFRDLDRLARILNREGQPVQIIFAGKAHPADQPGQELIRRIHEVSQMEPFRGKIVLVEGYDMSLARFLIAGVDVWLNNPQRPREASGTSGMKAALNGAINVSILDGWWCEGYEPGNGWVIGGDWDHEDPETQDREDAESLYDVLEYEVIPLYYQRNAHGLPEGWIRMAKESIRTISPHFNTDRMIQEYLEKFYLRAASDFVQNVDSRGEQVRAYTQWKRLIQEHWGAIQVSFQGPERIVGEVGKEIIVDAVARLGPVDPESVALELYLQNRALHAQGAPLQRLPMKLEKTLEEGVYLFRARFQLPDSGRYGYRIRVTPSHPNFRHEHEMGLVIWV